MFETYIRYWFQDKYFSRILIEYHNVLRRNNKLICIWMIFKKLFNLNRGSKILNMIQLNPKCMRQTNLTNKRYTFPCIFYLKIPNVYSASTSKLHFQEYSSENSHSNPSEIFVPSFLNRAEKVMTADVSPLIFFVRSHLILYRIIV